MWNRWALTQCNLVADTTCVHSSKLYISKTRCLRQTWLTIWMSMSAHNTTGSDWWATCPTGVSWRQNDETVPDGRRALPCDKLGVSSRSSKSCPTNLSQSPFRLQLLQGNLHGYRVQPKHLPQKKKQQMLEKVPTIQPQTFMLSNIVHTD